MLDRVYGSQSIPAIIVLVLTDLLFTSYSVKSILSNEEPHVQQPHFTCATSHSGLAPRSLSDFNSFPSLFFSSSLLLFTLLTFNLYYSPFLHFVIPVTRVLVGFPPLLLISLHF